MRNPNRIKPFCDLLATKWEEAFPDWRFGQLMSNFLGWAWEQKNCDIFFIEDDEMKELFENFSEHM